MCLHQKVSSIYEESVFDSLEVQNIFISLTAPKLALRPTCPLSTVSAGVTNSNS
jgi:hypothetical protein